MGEEARETAFVCLDCIKDKWFKNQSSEREMAQICAGCGRKTMKALGSKSIADTIRYKIMEHFVIADGLCPGDELSLSAIVGLAIRCNSAAVCESVAQRLIDTDSDEDAFYYEGQEYRRAPNRFESEEDCRWWVEGDWKRITAELVHGRRFFNSNASALFGSLVFEAMSAGTGDDPNARAVITTLPAHSKFYRARIATKDSEITEFRSQPLEKLGAPPKDRAANNRMSPAGVPLMYVAADRQTAIAEVRPSIGDKVVVGEFVSKRELHFFDFTVLSKLTHAEISFFETHYRQRTDRRLLLDYLHELIARPVRAHDTDYVMTQALAEYIRYCDNQRFDGIAFRSVQCDGGINFVLFDKSAPEALQVPDWTPQFDMSIAKEAVTTYEIKRVQYEAVEQQMPS